MSDRTQPLDPATIRLHRSGDGPALVMLHCLGMTHHLWDCLGGLADRHTLISYDLPGHGETALPAHPYGIEELSDQLAAVLRREGIARAHIMGISLGGLIAQHFAATEPAMVDRLVLCDTTPRYTDEARANWAVRAAAARRDGAASLLPMIEKIWFTPGFVASEPPAVKLVRDTFRACSGQGYALACEALGAADLRDLAPPHCRADAGGVRQRRERCIQGRGTLARRAHRRRAAGVHSGCRPRLGAGAAGGNRSAAAGIPATYIRLNA